MGTHVVNRGNLKSKKYTFRSFTNTYNIYKRRYTNEVTLVKCLVNYVTYRLFFVVFIELIIVIIIKVAPDHLNLFGGLLIRK